MDHEAELAFPLEDCSSALKTLKRLLDNSGMAVNFITEVSTMYCIHVKVKMKAMITSVWIDLHISHSPACTGLHSGFGAEGGRGGRNKLRFLNLRGGSTIRNRIGVQDGGVLYSR